MTEFLEPLPRAHASRLKPGNRGIGVIDLGDGQPFPLPVTVQLVTQEGAVVRDMHGWAYKTTSLLAVNQDIELLLEQREEEETMSYELARRSGYKRGQ